ARGVRMNSTLTSLRVLRRFSPRRPPYNTPLVRTIGTTADPLSPPRRSLSTFTTVSLAAAASLGAYTLGAFYPPTPISLLHSRPAPAPPTDPLSPESLAYTAALQALPALAAHRTLVDADAWYETRPYRDLPASASVNNLTAGALRGPGRLALFPLARVRKDESEAVVFVHLARAICGHDGIIHRGLLATLLDEALGRNVRSFLRCILSPDLFLPI
ncbi:hypothetical protein B0H13DRAFT_1643691, partial [Mycena leptocephala]